MRALLGRPRPPDIVEIEELLKELSDPLNHCKGCGNIPFCFRCSNFCAFCGTKNPNFNESELILLLEESLADFLEDCQDGHSEGKELVLMFPDQPYCMFCGELLKTLQ